VKQSPPVVALALRKEHDDEQLREKRAAKVEGLATFSMRSISAGLSAKPEGTSNSEM